MSETRDIGVYLDDMLTAAEKITNYGKDLSCLDFIQKEEKTEAILYNLLILGEAAKGIPEDFRNKYPEIPWREITGMRDKIIHQYWGINQLLVWKTITEEIPPLIIGIKSILAKLDKEE